MIIYKIKFNLVSFFKSLPIYTSIFIVRNKTKNFFKYIFNRGLSPNFKFQRHKLITLHMISIYHYSANNSKLTFWSHPFQMNDILNKLLHYLIHCVSKSNLLLLLSNQLTNLLSMRKQKMLNNIHLVIKIPVLEIQTLRTCFCCFECSNCSSTSRLWLTVIFSFHLTYFTIIINSDMWCK